MLSAETKAVIYVLIGAVFVAAHAASRFNTPPNPLRRSTTTFSRYYLAASVYALTMVALYVLFTAALSAAMVPKMLSAPPAEWVQHLPSQLYLALVVTVFLPLAPPLKQLDDYARQILQNMARIPFEARRLSAYLRAQRSITWTPAMREAVLAALRRRNVAATVVSFGGAFGVESEFARVAWLMTTLQEQEQRPAIGRFLFVHAADYARLRDMYEQLVSAVARYHSAAGAVAGTGRATRADGDPDPLGQWQSDLLRSLERFDHELCDFISYGALYASKTAQGLRNELSAYGFPPPPTSAPGGTEAGDRPPIVLNWLALVSLCLAILLFIALVVVPLLAGPRAPNVPELPLPLRLVMIITCFAMSLLVALLPKQWPWGRWLPTGGTFREEERPWFAYCVSGLLAACLALGIMTLFRVANGDDWAAVREAITQRWGWSVLMFFVSATTAYFADDPVGYRTRVRQGLLNTLMISVAMAVTQLCLALSGYEGQTPLGVIFTVAIAGAIGFVVAFSLPFQRAATPAPAPPAPAAAPAQVAAPPAPAADDSRADDVDGRGARQPATVANVSHGDAAARVIPLREEMNGPNKL